MAHIKCRYTFPYCTSWGIGGEVKVTHGATWSCDSDDRCPEGRRYTRPQGAKDKERVNWYDCVNPVCVYCTYKSGEFEKNVKQYEYFDGRLKVGNKVFEENEIDFLEIDGRVLIDEEETDETGGE